MRDLDQSKIIIHQQGTAPYRKKLNISHNMPVVSTCAEDTSKGKFSNNNNKDTNTNKEITKILIE